jgi:hypothetical protein
LTPWERDLSTRADQLDRFSCRIGEVASAADQARAGEAMGRMVRAPEHVGPVTIACLLWLAVIYVMVVKPNPFWL